MHLEYNRLVCNRWQVVEMGAAVLYCGHYEFSALLPSNADASYARAGLISFTLLFYYKLNQVHYLI